MTKKTWSGRVLSKARADLAIFQAIQEHYPGLSRNQIQRLIEDGRVSCDGKIVSKANLQLEPNSLIEILFPPLITSSIIPEQKELEILYEDDSILVINKPQELTVHPSPTQTEGTLVHALLAHTSQLSRVGDHLRPGIVHRIDKNTSGALVVAKSDEAYLKLSQTFANHQIERVYWALCYQIPKGLAQGEPRLVIQSKLGRSSSDRKKMSMNVRSGKEATTYVETIQRYAKPGKSAPPFASWLKVTLHTGRTHQVRVHLTGMGSSILGDPEYGAPSETQWKWKQLPSEVQELVDSLPGQALHARVLGFEHPINGKSMRFEADPPAIFSQLLELLKPYQS